MPGLFAFASRVVKDPQMATCSPLSAALPRWCWPASRGRRDKLVAHAGLAVTGSVLLVIGTAVSSSTVLAAVVTLVVAFCVLFAGVTGPNAASGATAALLAYVLPAASPGTVSMIPDRLAGWWLASAVGTLAVVTLSPRPAGSRLRATAATLAAALADQLDSALAGGCGHAQVTATKAAKAELLVAFLRLLPYRPTGLALPDQALANLVEATQLVYAYGGPRGRPRRH